jgi:hypothetical protein
VLAQGRPHPRYYGTFPRVLGRYVREEKVLSLEEAVKKMTSDAPAGRTSYFRPETPFPWPCHLPKANR